MYKDDSTTVPTENGDSYREQDSLKQPTLSGVWCLHCELVTLDEDVGWDEFYDWDTCAHCDAGELDLWPVRGVNLRSGMHVATGSQELVDLRAFLHGDSDYPDDDQPWPGEGK